MTNQEALQILLETNHYGLEKEEVSKAWETLDKAINDLELKDKALDKACNVLRILNNEKNNLRLKKLYLRQAKEELENGK